MTTSEKHRIKALVDINVVVAKWRHMKVELALSLDNFTYLFIINNIRGYFCCNIA